MIKQAILTKEKELVKNFLAGYDLGYSNLDESYYMDDQEGIIATLSLDGNILKGLATNPTYRGENLAGELVGFAINLLRERSIYSYHVFTKSEYIFVFSSMGFRLLADTGKVAFMEGGVDHIEEVIHDIQKQAESHFGIALKNHDIGTIVVNCNPITLGHYQLIENASKDHEYLLVFVVETDESTFTYKERFSLVYLALKPLANVLVLPSTNYIVSKSTFPSYFLKRLDDREKEHAMLDALIFKHYFMPLLNIRLRHVGTETDAVMVAYNTILKETLGNQLKEIERYRQDEVIISASLVRRLMNENKIDEALTYVPNAIRPLLRGIMMEKHGK